MDKNGFNAKELAHDIVVGAIANIYNQETIDLENAQLTKTELKQVKKHLALIHKKLLDTAKLDGLPLE